MSMTTQQTERELFEEHIRSLDYYPADAYRYEADCDEYSHPSINNAYSEWKSYRQPLIEEIYMLKSTIAQQGEALDAAKKDSEWQPIETAPKDCADVFVWNRVFIAPIPF